MNLTNILRERESQFVEEGAALEHARWSRWHKYFLEKCNIKTALNTTILELDCFLYDRWTRQMTTDYSLLSEAEKESDRKEARTYLPLHAASFLAALEGVREVVEGMKEMGRHDALTDLLTYLDKEIADIKSANNQS